jgi:hypothetical protein
VPVPKFKPTEWEGLMREVADPETMAVQQTGQFEFAAIFEEDARVFRVRFKEADIGEEHLVRLYPGWLDQKSQIARAFRREMIPDHSHPLEVGAIFVTSADGAPPDQTFDRVMAYTIGATPRNLSEVTFRIHSRCCPWRVVA